MTGRLDWRRARPHRPTESVLGEHVELRNGERTPRLPKDTLQRRADKALKEWRATLSPRARRALDTA